MVILSALKLASPFPSVPSASYYSYICIGEGFAWLIAWILTLGFSNEVSHTIQELEIVTCPIAAVLVFKVTEIFYVGSQEGTFFFAWESRRYACSRNCNLS